MKLLRKIAIVFVPIYWVITWIYHRCYDWGFLTSKFYKYPIICVGNLVVGGTGKTPMIEYLIEQFQSEYRMAVLSRGYKRKTKGFVLATSNATVESIGDEPFQFYSKYENLTVAVDEQRQRGIQQLLKLPKKPQIILLDDAFQHRKVKTGCNMLLTAYNDLYTNDILLPTGNLREPIVGANRAHIVVVTKCPPHMSESEQLKVAQKLNLNSYQSLFFSSVNYGDFLKSNTVSLPLEQLKATDFTLVTGIANPQPLVDFLEDNEFVFEHLWYSDHHYFLDEEIKLLESKHMIVTTEKDYTRLQPKMKNFKALYYLPITINLNDAKLFKQVLKNYIKQTI